MRIKLFHQIRAGAEYVPALLILIYFIIIILDILTTFLASPNLLLEENWVIRNFKLGWVEIIILSSISVIVLTFCLYFSFFYLDLYYRQKSDFKRHLLLEIIFNKRLFFCLLVLTCFYSHFSYSVFVVVNNYLSYVYLFNIHNSLNQLAHIYISNFILKNIHIYKWFMVFFVLLGASISFYRINQIRQKYFLNKNN